MSTAQTTSRIFQFPNFLSIANRLNGAFLHAPYRSQSRCSHTAEVWLLRSWEARNINKKKLLLSVDIHRWECNHCCFKFFFFHLRISEHKFRERPTEGSVYTSSGFDVVWSNPKFRLSDTPFSVRFNEGTELEKLAAYVKNIPTEFFRFDHTTNCLS